VGSPASGMGTVPKKLVSTRMDEKYNRQRHPTRSVS
jgi:hypothetical protein